MNKWRVPTPGEVLATALLIWLLWVNAKTWQWALGPMKTPTQEVTSHAHMWHVGAQNREADHIATSAPNYMGNAGFCVDGYAENNQLIWSVCGVTELEQVR